VLSCRSTAEAHLFSGDLVQRVFSVLQDGGRIVLVSDFVVERVPTANQVPRETVLSRLVFCFASFAKSRWPGFWEGKAGGKGKRKMGEKKGETGKKKGEN